VVVEVEQSNWYVEHLKKEVAKEQMLFFSRSIEQEYARNESFDAQTVRLY